MTAASAVTAGLLEDYAGACVMLLFMLVNALVEA